MNAIEIALEVKKIGAVLKDKQDKNKRLKKIIVDCGLVHELDYADKTEIRTWCDLHWRETSVRLRNILWYAECVDRLTYIEDIKIKEMKTWRGVGPGLCSELLEIRGY